MKVIISSARRGLEAERDCLPGLLRVVGHEPLHFEEFTAKSMPSREACMRAVEAADVYLGLIGEVYGASLPETGMSPTHEEYNAARIKGIPRLIFVKNGVDFDAAQKTFLDEVQAYSTGLFRDNFDSAADLQAKVLDALKDLPDRGRNADWVPLKTSIEVEWREGWGSPSDRYGLDGGAQLEVHAIPVESERRSARQLREAADQLGVRVRSLGVVPTSAALDVGSDSTAAWVLPASPRTRGPWGEVRAAELLGVRLSAAGQRSAWEQLPSDTMGSILDPDDVNRRIGEFLRLLGQMAPLSETPWALAVGLRPSVLVTVGSIQLLGQRSSASGFGMDRKFVGVEPDEAAGPAALDTGADEVASVLANNLLKAFNMGR